MVKGFQGRSQHGQGAIAAPPDLDVVPLPVWARYDHSRKPAIGNGAIVVRKTFAKTKKFFKHLLIF